MVTRLGLQIPSFTLPGLPDEGRFEHVAAVAETAEQTGFDSVWVMDHFLQIPMVGVPEEPMFEAYTLLGALAARTRRARLGAMVTGVTYRAPAVLAKQVTALDVISGGRAVLGIGAAWHEAEHIALGVPFPPLSERYERLEEAVKICRAMFTEDAPSFRGRHYTVVDAVNRPRPLQAGGPPILIGGSGERRTLRLVARLADACNLFGDRATIERKLAVLDRHCEDAGRDPASVSRTRLGTVVLGDDDADAERRLGDLAAQRGVARDALRPALTVGGPDRVAEEAAGFIAAGLDGLVVNLPDIRDLDHVRGVGETLRAAVA